MLFYRFDDYGVERNIVDFDDTFVLRDIADVSIFINDGIGDIVRLKKQICAEYDFLCVWKNRAFPIKHTEKLFKASLEQAMRDRIDDNLCWVVGPKEDTKENFQMIRAQKISFPANSDQTTNMLYELGCFLDPGENMIVSYENGQYIVEFEHEEVFDDFNMPEKLLKLLQRVS